MHQLIDRSIDSSIDSSTVGWSIIIRRMLGELGFVLYTTWLMKRRNTNQDVNWLTNGHEFTRISDRYHTVRLRWNTSFLVSFTVCLQSSQSLSLPGFLPFVLDGRGDESKIGKTMKSMSETTRDVVDKRVLADMFNVALFYRWIMHTFWTCGFLYLSNFSVFVI